MRVISIAKLREFWETPGNQLAEHPLKAWHQVVNHKDTDWKNWGDVKDFDAKASICGDCIVFNIGGNKFRLVVKISYMLHKVFIGKVMTHQEYDKNKWKEECKCHEKTTPKSSLRKEPLPPPSKSKRKNKPKQE